MLVNVQRIQNQSSFEKGTAEPAKQQVVDETSVLTMST